jgi:hypothetical protein
MLLLMTSSAQPATTTLIAARDNSIFQDHTANSGGGGPGIFSGTNGNNSPRRALVGFDVLHSAANPNGIPAGATITGVELGLHLGNAPNSNTHNIGLHKLTKDWGEGTAGSSNLMIMMTGQGFDAGEGDATWTDAMWSSTPSESVPWANAGAVGNFNPTASATTPVSGPVDSPTPFVWASTAALVADVQGWLDSPVTNFGWLLINEDESTTRSIKAFYSSEATLNASGQPLDPTWRPSLTITYSAASPPTGDYNGNGIVDAADYVVWRNTLAAPASPAGSGADGNQSGAVDPGDYTYWRNRFGNVGSTASAVSIPETSCCVLAGFVVALAYLTRRRYV